MYFFETSGADSINRSNKSYRETKDLATRKAEYDKIMKLFPGKVPIILERYSKETELPLLDKPRILVSEDTSISSILMFIRKRLQIKDTQSIYLVVDNIMVTPTTAIFELSHYNQSDDGFVYLTYASQNVFGSM